MRQMRAQLQAKCENAPLRRSVTERATRSTLTAAICEKSYKHKELRLFAIFIGNFTDSSMRQWRCRRGRDRLRQRASSRVRAE